MCQLQFLSMRATSDQHISINIVFELKPQSKEASGGNIEKPDKFNDK